MHITILALGSTGDILPYIALGKGLLGAGHEVRMITFQDFASRITEPGMDFHPVQGDPKSLVLQADANILSLARSFGSLADGYARDLFDPALLETDLILNQLPGGLYGYDLAEKAGAPMMLVSVIPLARTKSRPLVNFPALPIPGYNQLTYTLGEWVVWKMFQKTINRWRNETLDLPPVTFESYFHSRGTARMPIINGFSPAVVSRPPDWGDEIHITGYWFPEDKAWQPPVDLVAFLEGGPPPVFIGFGSMPVKNPIQTTRVILEALQTIGQRAVLGDGWSGIGDQTLPETVYKIQYAPYEWLFPQMAMVIHHGGSGTTAAGLRAGVPSCAVPFLFDQEYWGKRIASLGVGPDPIPYRKLSASRLVRTINQGINDPEICENAKKLGQRIRTENGVQTAVKIVNRYLWVK